MSNETYLLLVSIGPVQDFIAAARRTSDLWYGSWLLSELAKSAARCIVERQGEESLIFPALPETGPGALDPGSDFNVANKILAQVTQPETLAEEIRSAILQRLRELWEQARQQIRGAYDEEQATQQIEDLVEFYWAAVPLPRPASYPTARAQVETLMAARKNTRDFRPVRWSANRYKSPLDGQRESVLPEKLFERLTDKGELYRRYRIKPDEWLSGVDLLKRHGDQGSRWPSTSEMAAWPLKSRLLKHHGEAVRRYLTRLRELHDSKQGEALPIWGDDFDGELLFEDRLREFFDEGAGKEAQRALSDLLKSADAEKPLPYYAILQADGDGMGQLISRLTALPPADEAIRRHRELSRALTSFAGAVRSLVTQYDGALIYSGGDDVLALVPLHTALACANDLAAAFRARFRGEPYRYRDGDRERQPTLSVGISIVHHMEPLYYALELARRAERRAKLVPGKNALAVLVNKRGGVERVLVGSWAPQTGESTLYERLEFFRELHREKKISGRTAYELRDVGLRLATPAGATPGERELFEEARRWEALRILSRKREEGGEQMLSEADRERLERFVEEGHVSLTQLADELIVASLLVDAGRRAEGSLVQQEGNA